MSDNGNDKIKNKLFNGFFLVIFIFLLYQLLLILSVFADVIIWAVAMTLVFWPLYKRFRERCGIHKQWPPLTFSICLLLVVLLPLWGMFSVVLDQSVQLYPIVERWIAQLQTSDSLQILFSRFEELFPVNLTELFLENASLLPEILADAGTATARNLLLGIINLILIITLMYFCFKDGEQLLHWLIQVLPMDTQRTEEVAGIVYVTTTAVIRSAFMTAGLQGALAMVGYLIAGVPLAILFGVLTGFAALIPVVGSALIWMPLAGMIYLESEAMSVFLVVWGIVVSMSDNLVKPFLIGNSIKMPFLLIFCSMIGGANIYGVTGFIVGPILVSVLLAFVRIYQQELLVQGKNSG